MTVRTEPLYLAEITVNDPATGGTRVLRYATEGFVTRPSESPPSTYYDGRIANPVDIARTMFGGTSTLGRSEVGIGNLVLRNPDSLLDDLNDLGFDGQQVVVRRTTVLNPVYPTDFTSVTLTCSAAPEMTSTEIRLALRDRQQTAVSTPFQTAKFAGSNSLPNGLEGVSDLKGKRKPILYGAAKKVPAPCVNSSKQIYAVNDGPITSVDAVYDRGIALVPGLVWSTATSPFAPGVYVRMFYVNGKHVVISGGVMYTATVFGTWTAVTLPVGFTPTHIAYGAGLYVVAGGLKIYTTTDFVTWTSRTWPGGTAPVYCLEFLNGLFLLGLDGTTTPVVYSSDGITWTFAGTFAMTRATAFAYGGAGVYVVAGQNSGQGTIATAVDGITWTVRASTYGNVLLGTALYSLTLRLFIMTGDEIIAGGLGVPVTLTSVDGLVWTKREGPFGVHDFSMQVKELAGRVYSIGQGYGIAVTDDGITWSYNLTVFSTLSPGAGMGNLSTDGTNLFAVNANNAMFKTTAQEYASLADLLDDTKAPQGGSYIAYSAGGYFRLGSKPAGLVTADATQGATAADRTAGQQFKLALARAGLTSSSTDYSAADITALDAANSSVLGFWTMDDLAVADVLDRIAESVGAGWWVAANGVFRIAQLTAPSGTPALSIIASDMKKPLERVTSNDIGAGIPVWKSTVRWGRYYAVQTTDVATGVTADVRAQLAQEWRAAEASDATVLAAHPLSQELAQNSLLTTEADALAEAARRLALRVVKRDFYETVLEINDETNALDINSVIEVVHQRFGLSVISDSSLDPSSSDALFRVLDVRPNAAAKELTLTLWGKAGSYNVIGDDSALLVGDDGSYLVSIAEH